MELIALEAMTEAAGCLKTLAHPLRLRMVELLLVKGFTVGELADACNIAHHMASEHLSKMKDRGLLKSEKSGRYTYYEVAKEGLEGILHCIEVTFGNRKEEWSGKQ
jgi:DNA-binding transcriptional ArsR family regulator